MKKLREILCVKDGFKLVKEKETYLVIFPHGETLTNMFGTKEEVCGELKRWKKECDYNNPFMLDIENTFIQVLEAK